MPTSSIEADAPRIIHSDEQLLGVYKPAGVPAQRDPSGAPCITDLVGAEITDPPHRLDRPVSGVMVLARSREALSRLTILFREGRVSKCYLAVVEGSVEKPTEWKHVLVHDPRNRKARVVAEGTNGREARLSVKPVVKGERYTLLVVRPEGGQFHQIRAQLAAVGHPIHGDVKYGARRSARMPGIALHAMELAFDHPFTGQPIVIRCAPPAQGIWKALAAAAQ